MQAQSRAYLEVLDRQAELPDDIAPEHQHRRPRKMWMLGGALAVLAVAGVVVWQVSAKPAAREYSIVAVRRGDLRRTISATGKVQAMTTVEVGTQVSGIISEIHADFNDRVHKGQIIARLDPSQLEAQLAQARANLESARARVRSADSSVLSADASVEAAQANLDRAGAGLRDAQRSYDLAKELIEAGVKPRRDLDPAQGAVAQAAAQRQQALAQLNQAKAQAQSARSQLDQSRAEAQQSAAAVEIVEVNLDRSVIRAPIDGTVIARNVNVGQTVSASLQAPTLFLIANDLARMQVLADIDEADVGQLRPDSAVTFTVDAFPQDTFSGRISQIRLAPQTVQNVVTYTAVVAVDNPDLKLRPGMTATMTATVAERKDVLMVSNAALRFRPQTPPVVWLASGEGLSPVRVQTGMTDGVSTEVIRGELKEGDLVAVPAEIMSKSGPISRSPFSPGSKGSAGGRRR